MNLLAPSCVLLAFLAVACGESPSSDGAGAQAGASDGSSGAAGNTAQGGASGSVGGGGGSSGSSTGGGGNSAGTSGAGAGGMVMTAMPPNVVMIVADDLGYSDLGSYGGEIQTPNVDALAENGLRFTNFFNSSRCSPTRASLLTGQYPHRVNLAQNGRDLGKNGLTIAEALSSAGYNTALAGKWHLSATPELASATDHLAWLAHQLDPGVPFSPDLTTYPVGRGFQRHYGPIWGVVNYFDPFSLVDGTDAVESVPEGFYMTSAVSAKAVEYIGDFAAQPQPFFLYVAFTAPHWPLHALPEDIAKYEGVYDVGWTEIRNARYQRQLDSGLFAADNAPLPATQGNDWAALTSEQRTFLANAMQAHAAMVDRVDQGVGEIVAALKAAGRFDDTLLLFLSDNGASSEIYLSPGFDRPAETRAGDPIVYCGGTNSCPYAQPGSEETWGYLAQSWANAANTPFRYWKGDSFRGGNTTPFIAHWPAGLKAELGSVTEQPAHVIDVLPTILAMADLPYPDSYDSHELTPLDGTSLLPILEGEMREPHPELFFEHESGAALIQGDYKSVRPRDSSEWELYDLASDRTETTNLAAANADLLAGMTASWQGWYDSVPH